MDDITHFSMVGFPLDIASAADLAVAADKPLRDGFRLGTTDCRDAQGGNTVCVVRDKSGGELWYGLRRRADGHAEMITLNPAFAGEGRATLRVAADNSDPEWKPFEASVYARFSGEQTPIVFDLADPQQAAAARLGADVTVSLTAFGYAPEIFGDEKSYYAAQKKTGQKVALAANMFIPTGTFFKRVGGAMPDDAKRPTAYADFAGTILKAELRSNGAGGGRFWVLLARTYGGATIDVVVDPASIKVEPKPGHIVTGRFWLSGRIIDGS